MTCGPSTHRAIRLAMRPAIRLAVVALACALVGLSSTGCDGLTARRAVRHGNEQFKAGEYEKAIVSFDQAIKLEPNLAIAHHNLGLAYYKLSGGTADADDSRKFADSAAEHLGEYLKQNPTDSIIRNKMTQIWVDSGNFEKALAYWAEQLQAEPGNQEVMAVLSGINFKAGRWEPSLEWLTKSIAVSKTPENKLSLYVQVGRRCRQVITNREKIVGDERLKVSDVCIPIILQGLVEDPKSTELHGMVNVIMGIRALSQGASFANAIDKATGQDHDQLRRVLVAQAKKAQEAANPTPPDPANGSAAAPSPTPPSGAGSPGSGSNSAGSASAASPVTGSGSGTSSTGTGSGSGSNN